jgi:hypothetical protein
MNRRTARRALRAVPPLVVLAATVALAAPAHADPPTSTTPAHADPPTSTGGVSQLAVVITDPGPPGSGRGPKAAIAASQTGQVVMAAAAGLPPPVIDD